MDFQANKGCEAIKWPFPIKYEKINHVYVDVLVIGGGLAGGCAGIAAARKGAKVAVVDKAPIKRSGCGGAGMDHYNTVLDNPKTPMTPEENMDKATTLGRQGHRDYIAVKGAWDALMELEAAGLPVRDVEDDFAGEATRDEEMKILKAYDYRDLISVKLMGGHYIKPVIHAELKKQGVLLFERVMVTNLLTLDGKPGARVVGATGFSMETGEFYVFHAKSVIISTGYICTLWTFSTEITGNSYRWDPNEIGDGFAMAWKAGAEVLNMHKNGHTKSAHPFAWPRFGVGNPSNTWYPCTIVDNNGKEIPWEDKNGNLLSSIEARNLPVEGQPYCGSTVSDDLKGIELPNLVHDLPERIRNGEFVLPLWADLPSMPEAERRSIWGVMVGNEGKSRYTIFDLYTRSGFNPDKDMLQAPVMLPEGYKSGGWFQGEPNAVKPWRAENFGGQGEPSVDWNMMTTVGGLYVAGAASGLEGCSFACSSGFYCGNRAVEYSAETEQGEINEEQLNAEINRVYAPVRRAEDPENCISWKELWAGSARVMQQDCAENLTIPILEHGLMWLKSIQEHEAQETYARNPHELARVLECETRITCSEVIMRACIEKLKADEKGIGRGTLIFNQMVDGEFVTRYRKDKYWLEAPYASSYLENYQIFRSKEN